MLLMLGTPGRFARLGIASAAIAGRGVSASDPPRAWPARSLAGASRPMGRTRRPAALERREAAGGASGLDDDDRDMSAGHHPEDARLVALALSGGSAGRDAELRGSA